VEPKAVEDMSPTMRATRRRILEGAMRTMRGHGIEPTTVEDILSSAAVSRRTFYQYFKSKTDLLVVVYDDAAERLIRLMSATIEGEAIDRKLVATIDGYLAFQRAGGGLIIALQAEAVRFDSRLSPRREQTLDTIVQMIDKSIRETLSLKIDPLAYRALLIAIDGMVMDLQKDGEFTEADSLRVRAIAIVLFAQLLAAGRELPVPDWLES
jgi:AcrR family transcriptional regulator